MAGTTSDLRPGAVIIFNGELNTVLESEHRTPGNLRAFFQVKMRSLKTGRLYENRFRSGESIEFVRVEKMNYQYLYNDGSNFYFMNPDTYEQIPVERVALGDAVDFLKDNQEVQLTFVDNNVIGVDLPSHVILKVVHTEPGLRGDTATNVLKPATLETGASINVPLFINEGDVIRVDTRNNSYVERVKE